jgi:hypothetical protein
MGEYTRDLAAAEYSFNDHIENGQAISAQAEDRDFLLRIDSDRKNRILRPSGVGWNARRSLCEVGLAADPLP